MNAFVAGIGLLPWQEGMWSRIEAMLAAGRPPHGLLLHGPGGIGKRRLASRIAGAILCSGPGSRPGSAPCGACRSCHLLGVGSHPDFLRIEPGEGEAVIPIGSVRDLIDRFTLTAERGPGRGHRAGGGDEPGGRERVPQDSGGAGRERDVHSRE